MTGNTHKHLLIKGTIKKSRGVDEKTSHYLVTTIFTSCSPTHLLLMELNRLLIGMLSHTSSLAVQSCWILVGTGTLCRTCRSRASQTCSMGDMSSEYAGHGRTGTFSASRKWGQICHAETWGDGGGWIARQWTSWSRHGIFVHSHCHR